MSPVNRSSLQCWLAIPAAILLLLLLAACYVYFRPDFVEVRARRAVVQGLAEHFQSDVELQDLQIKLLPRLQVTGRNLSLRYHGRKDVPPFIQIASFSFSGGLLGLLRPVPHIPLLYVRDLQIAIPPPSQPASTARVALSPLPERVANTVLDRVLCEHAVIRILPQQGKEIGRAHV